MAPSEGQAEGAVEKEKPEPSPEAEDEERSDLIDTNDGKHGCGDRTHHSIADQPLARNGEVKVPVARSEDGPEVVVPKPVGYAVVEVINDPDLHGGGKQVQQEAGREYLNQPRIVLRMRDPEDDRATNPKKYSGDCQPDYGVGW